jgi:hypothetical protein
METKYYFISYRFCNPGPGPKEWMPNWTVTDKHPVELFDQWEWNYRVHLVVPVDFREITKDDYDQLKPLRPDATVELQYWRPASSPPLGGARVMVLVRNKEDHADVSVTGGHYHGNKAGDGWLVDIWRDSDKGYEVLGWIAVPETMMRVGALKL